MGLTLHYTLSCPSRPAAEVRPLIERLRKHALSLPFKSVSEVIELKRDECQFRRDNKGDPHAWLKVQTIRFQTEDEGDVIRSTTESNPIHIIAFTVQPGQGSEPANFGLCQYPRKQGWSWSSFCKTQYASNPSAGDVANFLKCHLGLIAVLDKAREMEILGEVHDEGKYWQNRDVEALVKEVGMWNRMVAGFYGQLRDGVEAADPAEVGVELFEFCLTLFEVAAPRLRGGEGADGLEGVGKAGEGAGAELFQAGLEGLDRAIVAGMGRVFAMQSPVFRDTHGGADRGRGAFGGAKGPNFGINMATLPHRTLAVASPGRDAMPGIPHPFGGRSHPLCRLPLG